MGLRSLVETLINTAQAMDSIVANLEAFRSCTKKEELQASQSRVKATSRWDLSSMASQSTHPSITVAAFRDRLQLLGQLRPPVTTKRFSTIS